MIMSGVVFFAAKFLNQACQADTDGYDQCISVMEIITISIDTVVFFAFAFLIIYLLESHNGPL